MLGRKESGKSSKKGGTVVLVSIAASVQRLPRARNVKLRPLPKESEVLRDRKTLRAEFTFFLSVEKIPQRKFLSFTERLKNLRAESSFFFFFLPRSFAREALRLRCPPPSTPPPPYTETPCCCGLSSYSRRLTLPGSRYSSTCSCLLRVCSRSR